MAKQRKVGEPAGTYTTKMPAKRAPAMPGQKPSPIPVIRYVDDATFRKAADQIFAERKDLLRRLAQ